MGHWAAEPVVDGHLEKVFVVYNSCWERKEDEHDYIADINEMVNNNWHVEQIAGISKDHSFCLHLKKTYYASNSLLQQ